MGYNSIEDIFIGWIHPFVIIGILWYFKRKKFNRRSMLKFVSVYCIVMSFAIPCICSVIKMTVSFTSLDQAILFYGENGEIGQPLIGKETALVPQAYNGGINLDIYIKRGGKWKIPDLFTRNGYSTGDYDRNIWWYTASIIPDKNTGGYYVVLSDATEQYSRERGIEDSEKSEFTYFGAHITKDKGCGVYYTYLNEIPEEYEMFIDGYKIQVEWDELFPKEQ